MPRTTAKTRSAPKTAPLAAWQPRKGGRPCSLSDFDPAAQPYSSGNKGRDKETVEALALEIDSLQDMLLADRRHKVLVVLQGMDGSGKDGTIRHVFGRVSPLGVHTHSWKAPTDEERAHDFLWRIHQHVPGTGELMIFNRSHYEDVLVPVVNGEVKVDLLKQRYRQINDFERLLTDTGTLLLKFMLHVSKEEQRQRLQARIDEPSKAWKFAPYDLEVRKQWDDYRKAYEALLAATHTAAAPWTIVPADSKTHRNLMIATLVRDALKSLRLRYPPAPPGVRGAVVP